MVTCYRSVCSGRQNVPTLLHEPLNQPQLPLASAAGLVDGVDSFLRQFEARLNSSWQNALFIKWYAVLINVVEACFTIYAIVKLRRDRVNGTGNSGSGAISRCLYLLSKLMTVLSNVLAIVGILKAKSNYLLPYFLIHTVVLVLELNYYVVGTALRLGLRKPVTQSSGMVDRSIWRALSMLAFIAFNLLIMIGARFATAGSIASADRMWSET
ncbi:uncharacterized protein LOC131438365 isoform X2 [Malaya genurostris]|uniref:uncharacterized protein LOC131438365 isoform X2 n=1 Tax=Malaya genurostris TaxID=325434 RepID=UPI0026F3EFC8|nr:uncharacterized protein LOC131438365 isoform X2 [Malaya genurostris]